MPGEPSIDRRNALSVTIASIAAQNTSPSETPKTLVEVTGSGFTAVTGVKFKGQDVPIGLQHDDRIHFAVDDPDWTPDDVELIFPGGSQKGAKPVAPPTQSKADVKAETGSATPPKTATPPTSPTPTKPDTKAEAQAAKDAEAEDTEAAETKGEPPSA